MSKNNNFEGDIALKPVDDGVDLAIEGGLFICDRGFGTAVFLSLFGGNRDDSGKIENRNGWWGNCLEGQDDEKLVSRFQHVITSLPMTTFTIREAEEAAMLDLAWFKDDGICDEILVSGQVTGIKSFKLIVSLNKSGTSLYKIEYPLQWEAGLSGIRE